MNNNSTNPPGGNIDLELIRRETKRLWLEANQERRGFLGWVDKSIPAWLIIIALVMLALSAPHTIAMFDRITPYWGWTAPFGVELGLLYSAFRRKRDERHRIGQRWFMAVLVVLLFITAILVNGAGSLAAAVSIGNIDKLSFVEIKDQLGTLPLTTQISLILALLAAIIIPLGTTVAGEGLAALFYDRDLSKTDLESQWIDVEAHELRVALFAALCRSGLRPADARRQAASLVSGFLDQRTALIPPSNPASPVPVPAGQMVQPGHNGGRDSAKAQSKTDQARDLLAAHPEYQDMTTRDLEGLTGIGKNIWSKVNPKVKVSPNGHNHTEGT